MLPEFAQTDQQKSDNKNDFDEIDSYSKAKSSFSKDESALEWWKSGH